MGLGLAAAVGGTFGVYKVLFRSTFSDLYLARVR